MRSRTNNEVSKLGQQLSTYIRLRGLNKFWFRKWIGMLFVRFGLWIVGVNVEIEGEQ